MELIKNMVVVVLSQVLIIILNSFYFSDVRKTLQNQDPGISSNQLQGIEI